MSVQIPPAVRVCPGTVLFNFSLIFACAFAVGGCATNEQRIEPTTSCISKSEAETAVGGPQVYNLSPSQRRLCEKRASEGDIVAAKTLVEYHEMITRDEKQYRHWLKVVARLEKAQNRQFSQLYDYYFPRKKKDLEASFYRRGFDETLFGPPPSPGQERRHVGLYFAFHNDASAFHKFIQNEDRDQAGEFSETWGAETLVLLLRLGDDRFAELLSKEDTKTREIVGGFIDPVVNWEIHRFPKTRACYSFRNEPRRNR